MVDSIGPKAMRRLLDYRWPGNFRELINLVEYAFAVGRGNKLTVDDLPPEFRESKPQAISEDLLPPKHIKYQNKADMVREALQMTSGNLASCALCRYEPQHVFAKTKKYNIESQLIRELAKRLLSSI